MNKLREKTFRYASIIFLSGMFLYYLIRFIYFFLTIDHPDLLEGLL
jgi:hypothetical protein